MLYREPSQCLRRPGHAYAAIWGRERGERRTRVLDSVTDDRVHLSPGGVGWLEQFHWAELFAGEELSKRPVALRCGGDVLGRDVDVTKPPLQGRAVVERHTAGHGVSRVYDPDALGRD